MGPDAALGRAAAGDPLIACQASEPVVFVDLGPSEERDDRVITAVGVPDVPFDSSCIIADGQRRLQSRIGQRRQRALDAAPEEDSRPPKPASLRLTFPLAPIPATATLRIPVTLPDYLYPLRHGRESTKRCGL